jgi:hypothetical protein
LSKPTKTNRPLPTAKLFAPLYKADAASSDG